MTSAELTFRYSGNHGQTVDEVPAAMPEGAAVAGESRQGRAAARALATAKKLAISFLLAGGLILAFGPYITTFLCLAVGLSEGSAYLVSRRHKLTTAEMQAVLFLNTISWLVPVFGLCVASFTYGAAEKQIECGATRKTYKTIALLALFLSIVNLAVDRILAGG